MTSVPPQLPPGESVVNVNAIRSLSIAYDEHTMIKESDELQVVQLMSTFCKSREAIIINKLPFVERMKYKARQHVNVANGTGLLLFLSACGLLQTDTTMKKVWLEAVTENIFS
jgi:hypothetical protein